MKKSIKRVGSYLNHHAWGISAGGKIDPGSPSAIAEGVVQSLPDAPSSQLPASLVRTPIVVPNRIPERPASNRLFCWLSDRSRALGGRHFLTATRGLA